MYQIQDPTMALKKNMPSAYLSGDGTCEMRERVRFYLKKSRDDELPCARVQIIYKMLDMPSLNLQTT